MFCRAPLRFPPALITIRAGPDGRNLPLIPRESSEGKFSPHLIAPIAKGKVEKKVWGESSQMYLQI